MSYSEEDKKRFDEHPCIRHQGEDDGCGALYDFPHPRVRCSRDGHTALQILDVFQCLDSLYADCPFNKECD